MCTNLGAWALLFLIVKITEPAGAMKWCNEEQFVDGEFPYYPYSNKIYSLSDGLTDDEALANEFSAVQPVKKRDVEAQKATELSAGRKRSSMERSQKSSFYEFKKDSDSVIDATKTDSNVKASKPVEIKKSVGLIGRLAQKKTKLDGAHRVPRSVWKREDVGEKPEMQIGIEQQTQFLEDGSNIKPAEVLADKILPNVSGVEAPEDKVNACKSNTEAVAEAKKRKPEHSPVMKPTSPSVKIHGPYENNFSGGGFRYTNPSTWLAREIEKFVRRNDYRWLDFMKNNGLGSNGVMVESKHLPERPSKLKKPRSIRSKETGKCQGTLLHQVDELLQDLSRFRASVNNGQSGFKKTREAIKAGDVKLSHKDNPEQIRFHVYKSILSFTYLVEESVFTSKSSTGLAGDDGLLHKGNIRKTRGITLPNFRGKSEHSRPHRRRVSPALVESDLKDLKRNIILYENNLPDEESRQALKDMRLHIKVYVESNTENCSKEEK